MQQYLIYPVKGKAAREYLELFLGCSVGTDVMSIPEYLEVIQTQNEVIYNVMHDEEKVFVMQYYLTARWRVIVPVKYRISFLELLQSYHINDLLAEAIIGSYSTMSQLVRNVPIQRTIAIAALKRISDYTGHPYDLENVRVSLTDAVAPPDYMIARK